ncbi:MAG: LptF/LptG family permease [Flavobacteriales bacterium]
MKKLSVLLLKSYIGPFAVTFLVAMFIFEMQFVWVYLDEMMGKGLGIGVILQLLMYASARLVNMALPLAILMSSIMTFGALSEHNELTSMKSAGISLFRIMRPLIIFSIVLSACSFVFANNIWPIANLKFRTLLYSIMQQRPALNLQDGIFYNGMEGISIRVMKNNKETRELEDILIYDHRGANRGNRTVIRAKKGLMEQTEDKRFLVLTLIDGYSYDEQEEEKKKKRDYPLVESHFEKSILRIDLSSFEFQANSEEVFKTSYEMMTINQLREAIDSLDSKLDSVRIKVAEANLKALHYKKKDRINPDSASGWFFNEMTRSEQQRALSFAKENSRRLKEASAKQDEEIANRNKFIIRHKVEWHRKFFLAVACLVLFFIGAPLGAIIRKGGLGMPTVIALGLFIFYQLLTIAGEKMAKGGILEPWAGMWLSTALFLPLSVWLTYKASKEAALLDKDIYSKFFKKIFAIFKRKKTVAA